MRIIAGAFRGVRLTPLGKGDAGAHLRPTPDRVRESLFSLLTARIDWDGIRVLDLFAGTGALGLEAVSRGAAHATFVETGRVGQKLIAANIAKLRLEDRTDVSRQDARRLGPAKMGADLVFLDPPYGKDMGETALSNAARNGWLNPGALVVWEEDSPQAAPEGFTELDQRRYGETHLTLLEFDAAL